MVVSRKGTLHPYSLAMRLWLRLGVPCTPTELAALFDRPVRHIRAMLYDMRKRGFCKRLDRGVRRLEMKTGPRHEYLWERA